MAHLTLSADARLARADAARARGDASEERAALEDALALARRADAEERAATDVAVPSAGVRYAQVLVRAGRCAEAQELVLALGARWPDDADVALAERAVLAVRNGAPFPAVDGDAAWAAWRRIRETALPCLPK